MMVMWYKIASHDKTRSNLENDGFYVLLVDATEYNLHDLYSAEDDDDDVDAINLIEMRMISTIVINIIVALNPRCP